MNSRNRKELRPIGLWENRGQFAILVLVNAFVGGMVGLERTIIPELATGIFGIGAKTAILSFIIIFGISKAVSNYYTGVLADRFGRRRLLIAGWLIGIPVPFLLIYAPSWSWVLFSNLLLGIHQGLCWSSTVVMKIDLAGPKNRGLAMGLNEASGYLAVGAVAFCTGWIASEYGLRPYPFYIGIAMAVAGLLLSIFAVRETHHFIQQESAGLRAVLLKKIFLQTSWADRNLGSITQAGFINNLNDGMIWGLLPMILAFRGFDLSTVGMIVAVYPAVWGAGQLITGKLADQWDKKLMISWGMILQGIAIAWLAICTEKMAFIVLTTLLGIGTAVVYPTFLAALADCTFPAQRGRVIGAFRLWRDLGYAAGAMLTGILADRFGLLTPVYAIASLTVISGFLALFRMDPLPPQRS